MNNLSFLSPQSPQQEPCINKEWLSWENKQFEAALAEVDLATPEWLEELSARLPSKTIDQLREHLMDLEIDIESIHLGLNDIGMTNATTAAAEGPPPLTDHPSPATEISDGIVLPSLEELREMEETLRMVDHGLAPPNSEIPAMQGIPKYMNISNLQNHNTTEMMGAAQLTNHGGMQKLEYQLPLVLAPPQSKKGKSWSEDEHRLFLMGLNVYGKGDWKNISRHFVGTRSSTQVASHAQKYFKRLEQKSKAGEKRYRPSIHDIKTITVPIRSGTSERVGSIYDMVDLLKVKPSPNLNINNQSINMSISDHNLQAPGNFNFNVGSSSNTNGQGAGASSSFYLGTGLPTYSYLQEVPEASTTFTAPAATPFGTSTSSFLLPAQAFVSTPTSNPIAGEHAESGANSLG